MSYIKIFYAIYALHEDGNVKTKLGEIMENRIWLLIVWYIIETSQKMLLYNNNWKYLVFEDTLTSSPVGVVELVQKWRALNALIHKKQINAFLKMKTRHITANMKIQTRKN